MSPETYTTSDANHKMKAFLAWGTGHQTILIHGVTAFLDHSRDIVSEEEAGH